jgi:hypothetical protein
MLTPEQTTYVCMVIAAMKKTPGAAPYSVAKALKKELGLDANHQTIARTLKEQLNA